MPSDPRPNGCPTAPGTGHRFAALGPATLVLDEAHHLVEVWGELLDEVLAGLPEVRVIGLTATPSDTLTPTQAALTKRLRPPVAAASIPALVKQGYLAPYAELAWLCQPTAREADWLHEDALRFAELQADLAAPGVASTDFFVWLDAYVQRMSATEWNGLADRRPDLATAVMRFHHAQLVESPTGARAREEYRQEPRPADWGKSSGNSSAKSCGIPRIHETSRCSNVFAGPCRRSASRWAAPASGVAGHRSTGWWPVARAKTDGAVEIICSEYASLGSRLRALVVVDHERATATLPARLAGSLRPRRVGSPDGDPAGI